MAGLSFGIKTVCQHTTYDAILEVWREADSIPLLEHAWLFDHLNPIGGANPDGPCLEGWTLLSACAAVTNRVRVGLMVTGNTYRHPALLAHMAATVDVVSNGRLDLGVGAGWNVYEHESTGIPLYAPGERVRRLGEACELMKLLFTEPVANYAGRYYQLKDARLEPKSVQKPYPPFVIGGSGEPLTLRVVARHADVWNYGGGPIDQFNHKIDVLREHCAAVGRDPAQIALSVQIVVNYDDLPATARSVQQFVDAGATHLVLNLRPPFPKRICTRLADEVIPRVRG